MITGFQAREARKLLNLSHLGLAFAAGVGQATVAQFETESSKISERDIVKIQRALESEGITFSSGAPRLSAPKPK